jgi:hypothetical protein
MACPLPGGVESPDQMWEALHADEYYDPEPGVPGRSVSRRAAFLDDVAGFDCEFFGMGERRSGLSRGLDYECVGRQRHQCHLGRTPRAQLEVVVFSNG